MPAPLISREEVLDRLTRVFREHGYGASLSQLSAATGLHKASLYHYFPGGKAEMAAAVIVRSNEFLEREIIAPMRGPGTPIQRLKAMTRRVERHFEGGKQSCLLGSLTHGGRPLGFEAHIEAGFSSWIRVVAEVIAESGVPPRLARRRAEDAIFAIEGALLVCHAVRDTAPFRRLLRDLPARMLLEERLAA